MCTRFAGNRVKLRRARGKITRQRKNFGGTSIGKLRFYNMDRVCRSDEDTFKNQHDELDSDYRLMRGSVRQSGDERDPQERRILKNRGNDYDDDAGDEADDCHNGTEANGDDRAAVRYTSARAGLCGVCHLTVGGTTGPGGNSVGFEQARSCDQGHLLCQRCVQRFAIRSDMGCILCRSPSNSSDSRDSLESLNRSQVRNPKNHREIDDQRKARGSDYHGGMPWARAHSEAPVIGTRMSFHRNIGGLKRVESCYSEWNDNGQIADKREEDNYPKESRHHQQRSYCSIIEKETILDQTPSETRVNGQIVTECSRRPIRCPRLDCAVNVAFSALTHHFLFDHPEVPILSVEPGAKSTLIVSFAALSCDSSRCLALLLVSGKLSGPASRLFNGSQIHPKYRNRLPLPVLAARLHCTSRYTNPDEVHASGEGHGGGGDVIIAWVAGLDIGNVTAGTLRCSIQAVDNVENESIRSLTYTGPVNSLRTAQRPREVFHTGDCVILHEGLVNHITSDCTSLNVNVIVH